MLNKKLGVLIASSLTAIMIPATFGLGLTGIKEVSAKEIRTKAQTSVELNNASVASKNKDNNFQAQCNKVVKPSNGSSNGSSNSSNESSNSSSSNVSAIEAEVAKLVNEERAKNGLKPLELSSEISKVARIKSQDMADKNYFNHTSPTYGTPFDMMKKFGISYSAAGENIAKGQTTAQSVMNSWMNSPGHRANILSANFGKIGVGYVIKNGTTYWTQMFTN